MEKKPKYLKRFLMVLAMVALFVASAVFTHVFGGHAIFSRITTMTEATDAQITHAVSHREHVRRHSYRYSCSLSYQFTVDGKQFTGPVDGPQAKFEFACPAHGERIPIIYNPQNPFENTAAFSNYNLLKPLAGLFMMVASGFTAVMLIFWPRDIRVP